MGVAIGNMIEPFVNREFHMIVVMYATMTLKTLALYKAIFLPFHFL